MFSGGRKGLSKITSILQNTSKIKQNVESVPDKKWSSDKDLYPLKTNQYSSYIETNLFCTPNQRTVETLCVISHHLYNSKNVKITHGGVLLFVIKVILFHWCFSHFLNWTNGTKLRKVPQITNIGLIILRRSMPHATAFFMSQKTLENQ